MLQQHLPISAEVRYPSVSPKVVDRKKPVLVMRDQGIAQDLSAPDICGLAVLSTA